MVVNVKGWFTKSQIDEIDKLAETSAPMQHIKHHKSITGETFYRLDFLVDPHKEDDFLQFASTLMRMMKDNRTKFIDFVRNSSHHEVDSLEVVTEMNYNSIVEISCLKDMNVEGQPMRFVVEEELVKKLQKELVDFMMSRFHEQHNNLLMFVSAYKVPYEFIKELDDENRKHITADALKVFDKFYEYEQNISREAMMYLTGVLLEKYNISENSVYFTKDKYGGVNLEGFVHLTLLRVYNPKVLKFYREHKASTLLEVADTKLLELFTNSHYLGWLCNNKETNFGYYRRQNTPNLHHFREDSMRPSDFSDGLVEFED